MKLALISDIYANLQALQATLANIESRSVDRIVCLGDIVGYSAAPAECIALIRRVDALCVAGDHDLAVCGRITTRTLSSDAARAVAWARERLTREELRFLASLPLRANIHHKLLAVHGALHAQSDCATVRLDNDQRRLQSLHALAADPSGARICAFGHTHRVGIFEFRNGRVTSLQEEHVRLHDDGYYLINPGTVGQPRSFDRRASYMVFDLAQRTLTLHRVSYDGSARLAAARKAGRAPAFAFIPAPVRGAFAAAFQTVGLDRPVKQFATYLGL